MFRKCIVLVLVMIFAAGTALAQDAHLEIELTVQRTDNENKITGSILAREQDLLVFSSLFPSYMVSIPGEMDFEKLFHSLGDELSLSVPGIMDIISESGIIAQGVQTNGIYSGDLFDEAKTMQTGRLAISDLVTFMESLPGYNEAGSAHSFVNGFLPGAGSEELLNAYIQYQVYDSGKYLTLNIISGDATIATVSFDFSVQKRIKILLGSAEEGKNYYLDTEMTETAENAVKIQSVLLADAGKNGYRAARENKPILESTWTFSLLPALREILINGLFVPSNGMESAVFNGTLSVNENPVLTMEFHFSGAEENRFIVGVKTSDDAVSTAGKTEISFEEITTAQGITPFATEISTNFLALYPVLIQAIPEGYQKMLVMLN